MATGTGRPTEKGKRFASPSSRDGRIRTGDTLTRKSRAKGEGRAERARESRSDERVSSTPCQRWWRKVQHAVGSTGVLSAWHDIPLPQMSGSAVRNSTQDSTPLPQPDSEGRELDSMLMGSAESGETAGTSAAASTIVFQLVIGMDGSLLLFYLTVVIVMIVIVAAPDLRP